MRGHPHRLMVLLLLAVASTVLAPRASHAKATCASQIDKAMQKQALAVAKKGAAACKKAPGGTCFNPGGLPSISGKALKKCDAATIQTTFAGSCPSRDASCKPSALTSADQLAQCLTCAVNSEVKCLTAIAFSAPNLPAYCTGSPSGAFLDPDDGFGE